MIGNFASLGLKGGVWEGALHVDKVPARIALTLSGHIIGLAEVEPEGEDELSNPTDSDLWRTVETSPSPVTIDVADFAAAEQGDNAQPARAILLVTDGTEAGATTSRMNRCAMRAASDPRGEPGKERFRSRRSGR